MRHIQAPSAKQTLVNNAISPAQTLLKEVVMTAGEAMFRSEHETEEWRIQGKQ